MEWMIKFGDVMMEGLSVNAGPFHLIKNENEGENQDKLEKNGQQRPLQRRSTTSKQLKMYLEPSKFQQRSKDTGSLWKHAKDENIYLVLRGQK